jgi:hypothetical protein
MFLEDMPEHSLRAKRRSGSGLVYMMQLRVGMVTRVRILRCWVLRTVKSILHDQLLDCLSTLIIWLDHRRRPRHHTSGRNRETVIPQTRQQSILFLLMLLLTAKGVKRLVRLILRWNGVFYRSRHGRCRDGRRGSKA